MDNLDKLIQDRIGELHNNNTDLFPGLTITISNFDCRSIARGAPLAYKVQLDSTNTFPISIMPLYSSRG